MKAHLIAEEVLNIHEEKDDREVETKAIAGVADSNMYSRLMPRMEIPDNYGRIHRFSVATV
ncbi:hypothetical protein Tco_0956424, partial [Tanacetum coccineum]